MIEENRTFDMLIKHSLNWYLLDETQTRKILKSHGYDRFDKTLWLTYLNILRKYWAHITAIENEKVKTEVVDLKLLEDYKLLEINVEGSCWKYQGPENVIRDIYERAAVRRNENVKRFVNRYVRNEITPFSLKPTPKRNYR